jgi:hypothetical protein
LVGRTRGTWHCPITVPENLAMIMASLTFAVGADWLG